MAAAVPLLGARVVVAPFGHHSSATVRSSRSICRCNTDDNKQQLRLQQQQQQQQVGYGGWERDASQSCSSGDDEWRKAAAVVAFISLVGGLLAGGGVRLAWGLVAGSMGAAAAIGGGGPQLIVSNMDRALEKLHKRRKRPLPEEVGACIAELERLVASPSDENAVPQMVHALEALREHLKLDRPEVGDVVKKKISPREDNGSAGGESESSESGSGNGTISETEVPIAPPPASPPSAERTSAEDERTNSGSSASVGATGSQASPDVGSKTNGSAVEDDRFTRRLKEAEALMEEGQQTDSESGNFLLFQACELVEEACRMRPSSLVAVGMRANALLVHGELKLKAAEKLRELLATVKSRQAWLGLRSQLESLQHVADGCEQLLVEAGRTYRKALTLRRDDVRALHNWGVALRLRARLISLEQDKDERAAEDADKVYLAAIDKFEALAGMSSKHQDAGAALLNWAMAVRDRSRLRSKDSSERIKLLMQAKELLRDASKLSSEEQQTQVEAELHSCEVELEELETYQELSSRKW